MGKGEPVSVEELALEAVLALTSIGGIARQGMPDRGEVGADLVDAAGLEANFDVALGAEQFEHLEVSARLARGGAGDGHAVALPRGAADRRVDRAGARGEATPRQG